MDKLTFASKLIWPIVILLLLWPCRKALVQKILALRRGKVSRDSIEGEFDIILDDVKEEMEREGLIELSPTSTPTSFQYEDEQKRKNLRNALLALSRVEKLILVLHYYEEISWDEISEVLGTPKENLVQRHKEILEKLKSMMNSSG